MTASLYPTLHRLALALVLASELGCSKDSSRDVAPFVPANREAVRRETSLLFSMQRDAGTDGGSDAGKTLDAGLPSAPERALPEGHPDPRLVLSPARFLDLRNGLVALGKSAPPGYPSWDVLAFDGAEAARRGDVDGTRASCIGCHERHAVRWRQAHPAGVTSDAH